MNLDLSQIRQPETEVNRRFDASEFKDRGGSQFKVVAPVDLRMTVYKDNDRFRLAGRVTTMLELACSRCVELFAVPVDASFDVRYLPQSANTGDEEREVEEDDLSDAFYRDDEIDLGQLMDEQFYLSLPMKPLCRAECKGLCPQCGTNLNVATCDCKVQWEDPRLAPLKALMNRNEHDA